MYNGMRHCGAGMYAECLVQQAWPVCVVQSLKQHFQVCALSSAHARVCVLIFIQRAGRSSWQYHEG
jgi:adenosine/AMP kinase